MNLECSSVGDKRFSALYAKVNVGGVLDTIERHYQFSKRLRGKKAPSNIKDIKGKTPIYFVVNNKSFGVEYLTSYYSLLWVKYLDANPGLVEYAKQFEDFTDTFRGKAMNCQADIIKTYIKKGRNKIMDNSKTKEFLKLINELQEENVITGDLLKSNADIIGHQVNCQGVMGAGLALSIRKKYPKVFEKYKYIVNNCKNKNKLMGRTLFLSENGKVIKKEYSPNTKIIANLFGQYNYGKGVQVDYEALENSLMELKKFAKENNLSVGIPYKIGCGLAGGDWKRTKSIIEKIFKDYPVNIYKKEG
jgi:O-acetyl-ADP-ribose deacetylase (regulator of RNase III)